MPAQDLIRHVIPFLPFLVVAIVMVVFGSFLLRIARAGGLKNMLFGAPIVRTVGEVAATAPFRGKTVIKVHVLGPGVEGREIGLECVTTAKNSYRLVPIPMSRVEAIQLIGLLQSATQ